MSEQNNAANSLAHTKWNCKYHVVFAPKYRRKVFLMKSGKTCEKFCAHCASGRA